MAHIKDFAWGITDICALTENDLAANIVGCHTLSPKGRVLDTQKPTTF